MHLSWPLCSGCANSLNAAGDGEALAGLDAIISLCHCLVSHVLHIIHVLALVQLCRMARKVLGLPAAAVERICLDTALQADKLKQSSGNLKSGRG